jgi:hypothetical protein
MNITKALQIIQDHPAALSLSVTVTDDGMIDASIASISPAGDTMETLASHLGPGSIEGAIIEMAQSLPKVEPSLVLNYTCSCYSPTSTICMVHGCVG